MKKSIKDRGSMSGSSIAAAMGIDIGDHTSVVCVVDAEGAVEERGRFRTRVTSVRKYFAERSPMRIAIEVSTHSPWFSRTLTELGHEVIVANSRKLHLISKSTKKNDPGDAELLARLARADIELLHPIQHRGEQAQSDLAKLRARKSLIRCRQQMIAHVRGAVKSYGMRIRACSTPAFHLRAPEDIPKDLWPAMSPLIDTIAQFTKTIRAADRGLERIARTRYPETERLRQVKGVGPILSLQFVLTLDDPGRFKKSRDVGSFVGLRPKLSESGKSQPELPITKQGDRELRALLVQGAHYILGPFGPDTDLRRWGLKLAARGGKNVKKKATIAVARKLSVLLHRLWVSKKTYIELLETTAQAA